MFNSFDGLFSQDSFSKTELYNLTKNSAMNNIDDTGLIFSVPLNVSNNINYIYTLKFPVFNNSLVDSNLGIFVENPINNWVRLNSTEILNIQTRKLEFVVITLRQTGAATAVQATYKSNTSNAAINSNNLRISLVFDTPSIEDVTISFYTLSLDYGTSTNYTENGSAACSATNLCLPGFVCVSSACLPCNNNCSKCTSQYAFNVCTQCSRQTKEFDSNPVGNSCTS